MATTTLQRWQVRVTGTVQGVGFRPFAHSVAHDLGLTGFVGNDGRVGRPFEMPRFIQFDRVPLPNSPNPVLLSILGLSSSQSANLCR